jgi:PPOX class probable F420-dependent enzyme
MTDFPESHRDLLDGQVATFATIDNEGFPQLTEVWFLHDEGELKFSFTTGRWKTRNLEQRPKCAVVFLDLENPYRYLEVRGRARIEPDDGSFAAKVGTKYNANVAEYDQPGDRRLVVTLEPQKIHPVVIG